jgi:hypothetical protein
LIGLFKTWTSGNFESNGSSLLRTAKLIFEVLDKIVLGKKV